MRLYLVDGYSYVFRAFHSLPPLTTKDGMPVGCIYGFCNMLYRMLLDNTADYFAVVLDSGTKNFRHDLYSAYKSHRSSPPEDLILQFPIIREALEAFNVKILEEDGVEADDIIAAYAKAAKKAGFEVIIASSDKDLMQLVDDKITLFDPLRNISIAYKEVVEKLSVRPNQVVDYFSLIGDTADNIPGVKGIGQKTAVKLLAQFDSLDGIYQNIDLIDKERIKNLLLEGKETADLSKQLVELNTNIIGNLDIESLKSKDIDFTKLATFLAKYDLKSLLSRISQKRKEQESQFTDFIIIDDLSSLVDKLCNQRMIAIYVEYYDNGGWFYISSEDLNYKISFSDNDHEQTLLLEGKCKSIAKSEILTRLLPILQNEAIKKILIDAKSFYKEVRQLGIGSLRSFEDISVMAYTLATGKHKYDLISLIAEYLNESNQKNSRAILILYERLYQALFDCRVFDIYELVEKRLIPILAEMEITGMKVDPIILKELASEFTGKIKGYENLIFEIAGEEFQIASPKQLGHILFEKMKIASTRRSKTGTYSANSDVLEKLSDDGYKIADYIMEWRHYTKLLSTYTNILFNDINPKTQRVHTTFEMTTTNTGRLSSRHPNLQNIPIRTEAGKKIRDAFIAESGKQIVSADYSQIELRLLAEMGNVESLKSAFIRGDDIHAITASEIFNVDVQHVSKDLRRKAKTINFGIIYGISAFGLAKRLEITQEEAKHYMDFYFSRYPEIKQYMDSTIKVAKENGYVETIIGRRCYINGINNKNFKYRSFAERSAINAPLQGSAADIIKKAMIKLPRYLQKSMIMQIHDELLFEVEIPLLSEAKRDIKRVMEGVIKLSIPLTVDISSGGSWGET